ncbi:MAG: DNA topoisomerase-1 [Candidatus Omnitrophota bacterium]
MIEGGDEIKKAIDDATVAKKPTIAKKKAVKKVAKKAAKKATKKKTRKKRVAVKRGAIVIVESPAKCRTIEKILGKSFSVVASMGHIIDLPKSKMGVDVENNFEPKYIVMVAKRKTLTQLKKIAKHKKDLYLACDPDREGEAISWHLGNQLGTDKNVFRVTFQEITPDAIRHAFANPKVMDMNKVGAQQARRILDRIVGYSLSPILWKAIAKGLSAGRVQSVALRLIVDQERRIEAFDPQEYWTLDAKFQKTDTKEIFSATLDQKSGKKIEIKDKETSDAILKDLENAEYAVDKVKSSIKKRQPAAPFTTSKLQQEAYNRLKLRPARTMSIAQSLYEGVDLGAGETVGLITYMRTDSTNVSDSALKDVREYIPERYGHEYLPAVPNKFKSKKLAQEAHEAIRPTSVLRTPNEMERLLTPDQLKLYTLIWTKFVASQMMPALMRQTSAEIKAGEYAFKASGTFVEFLGFMKADEGDEYTGKFLPKLIQGQTLALVELEKNQHFTKPPPRYTDASLVKTLEELGIGRPSTYAPIIQTIVSRTYVDRNGGALVPSELGCMVVDLLVKHFPELMDVNFTAMMEEKLDEVEEGKEIWSNVLKEFYGGFAKALELADKNIEPVRRVEEKTDEICELCSKPMVVKWGRRGKFLSCSDFPTCRFSQSIATKVKCPQCNEGLLVARKAKSGRGRPFFGCSKYPNCNYIANQLPSEKDQNSSESKTVSAEPATPTE